ncbi:MAG: signal peptidase I [Pseudoclavibacter sp.]
MTEPAPALAHRRDRRRKAPWWRWLVELLVVVLLAQLIAWGVTTFLFQPFTIPSGSMEQTLEINDRILVNKLAAGTVGLKRGDIVVFKDPGDWLSSENPQSSDDQYLVKRIIGLPGDTVSCTGTTSPLRINGRAVHEPYLAAGSTPCSEGRLFSTTVPRGSLWVMGDNRQDSADSSAHQTLPGGGSVPEADVVGPVFMVVAPLNRFRFVSNPTATFRSVPSAE